MKVIEDPGNYLVKNCRKGQIIFTINLTIFLILFMTSTRVLPIYLNLGKYNDIRVVLYVASGIVAAFYHKRYTGYQKGIEGEKKVTEYLTAVKELDSYTLINNFTPDDENPSNIDHIILGSNGIFVIETKNYTADKISFDRDTIFPN